MPCDRLVAALVHRVPHIHVERSRKRSGARRRFLVGLTFDLRFSAMPAKQVDRRGMNDAMNHDVLGERDHPVTLGQMVVPLVCITAHAT